MPTEADIRRFSSIIDVAARSHGVEPALVQAVITAESGFNPNALSRKGASGLMQLMPDTARRYGVQNIFDPVENIHGGVRYLRDLLGMFNGDMRLALAGYNAGENAVIRAGNRVPPYAETQNYVPKVIDLYHRFRTKSG
jgi:soluble lytic murein transglycosylase-like protein